MKLKYCCALLLALAPALAWAVPVNVSFSGNITSTYYATCTLLESGSCKAWDHSQEGSSAFYDRYAVPIGTSFNGMLTYNSATPLTPWSISDDGYQASYSGAVDSYSLTVGELSLPSPYLPATTGIGDDVAVVNGRYGRDLFAAFRWFSGPEIFATSEIFLQDPTGSVYSDFSIPTSFDLSRFRYLDYQLTFLDRATGDQLHANGQLSSFDARVVGVPEPGGLLLFFGGALVLLGLWAARLRTFRKHG